MTVLDYYENFDMPTVGTKLGIIAAYLLVVFFDFTVAFNIWIALVYLFVFAGVIYGYFAKHACPSCYYFGKRCSTGTGLVAAKLYRKNERIPFEDAYQKGIMGAIAVYLLPLPFTLIGFFTAPSFLIHLIFVGMMLFLLFVLFIVHRQQACRKCHNRDFCPMGPGAGGITLS